MQQLITAKQAKQITGGRTPFLPVEYEEAVKWLDACLTFDETKYWDNYADAWAAFAKMNGDDALLRKAKAFKLRVYRRLGELAEKVRPPVRQGRKPDGTITGGPPGAPYFLKQQGMKSADASSAVYLARMPRDDFDRLLHQPRPPAPTTARVHHQAAKHSGEWAQARLQFYGALAVCRKWAPATLARLVTERDSQTARRMANELSDWLDEFERHLPKGK